jgi:hypothetical protein
MKMTKVDALNIALSTLTADSYDVKYDVLFSDGTSTIRTETFTQQEVQEVVGAAEVAEGVQELLDVALQEGAAVGGWGGGQCRPTSTQAWCVCRCERVQTCGCACRGVCE